MKRWYQHRFHNVSVLSIVFTTMRWLPRFAQPPIAIVTALIFFLLLKRERRAVAGNLLRITGKRGFELHWKVYLVFYSFCDLIVSYTYVPQASHEQLLSMLADEERGAAVIDRCLAEGHGLIVWTAHLGNPEFASRLLEMHGRPVNVARVVEDKPAERMLRDRMSNERLRIVDLREGARATIELLQALRRNEIVAIQGDRVYNPHHGAPVRFFAAPVEFPLGPFLLSQVSGAPVLPGFVVRHGWLRYRVLLGEPIRPASSGNRDEDQRTGLRQAVRFLEAQLSNYYDQWVNFFDFWPVHSHD
ncbi:MAG TPA: lysophospholipid acyltransferase family protein [Terracidiphilus sp.]